MEKKLGFGCMRLPLLDKNNAKSVDVEQVKEMVDLFIERGFTYFDTAYMYHEGTSENFMKESLVDRYPRNAFTLADKMPSMYLKEKEDLERIFEEQRAKCGVEYFDYYLMHCLTKANYEIVQKLDAFAYCVEKKKEGKIKHLGFSFHDNAELLEKIIQEHPEVEFVQLQLNYLDWEDETVQARKCYEVCQKYGKKVIVMEPVKGGTLAAVPKEAEELMKAYNEKDSIASWAIRFAASKEDVIMVLSGMSNLEQVKDNTEYMQDLKPMNQEEQEILEKVVDIIDGKTSIPCTGCDYCIESGCPKKIAIPTYFALYNKLKRLGEESGAKEEYRKLEGVGRPEDCIKCGKCERMCPQHLRIRSYLEMVAKEMNS